LKLIFKFLLTEDQERSSPRKSTSKNTWNIHSQYYWEW